MLADGDCEASHIFGVNSAVCFACISFYFYFYGIICWEHEREGVY